ncbi:HIT family protein [uncultured Cytophaga sp.]|uniref:HIT family protein n=1 Tax=uncultured Cytophaga sp. TaxID=160238 RepID=UPI0026178577|nr:HIT family protein [uncultured Cytophaga sp.]
MPSIFTKIINKEIPGYIIAETDTCIAFLDLFPLAMGHVLIVPKEEIDYIFAMKDSLLCEMILFSKKISIALEKAVPCKRIGVAVIGLEVPHAHIHLLPLQTVQDINFSREKLKPSKEELEKIADLIKSYL